MKVFVQKTRLLLTFEITARRLQLMMSLGNIRALEDLGGADGVCRLLRVTPSVGLTKEERLDAYDDRCEQYTLCCFFHYKFQFAQLMIDFQFWCQQFSSTSRYESGTNSDGVFQRYCLFARCGIRAGSLCTPHVFPCCVVGFFTLNFDFLVL
jgi:hypothetical protein